MKIPMSYASQRVDRVLAQLYPSYSRAKLSGWLKEGSIRINQQPYSPDRKVIGGEEITFSEPLPAEPVAHRPQAIPLDVLFEDDHLLVLNKPAGLTVHPGAGNPEGTLLNALLHHDPVFETLPRAGIIHRLDKDTTGALIVAKSLMAHTACIRQMQARHIQRQYLALVYGHVRAGQTIHTHYGRDPRNRLKMAVLTQGKEAITEFSVLKRYTLTSLLQVKLHTGRTHQIRVHMAHIRHPLVGDPLYTTRAYLKSGPHTDCHEQFSQLQRQALHAQQLSLTHPVTGEAMSWTAPIPSDLQALLTFLEQHKESDHGNFNR